MTGPLTMILLVAAGESADPVTRGIAAATASALGAEGRVLVHGSVGPPNDQQALDLEASEHADAVVELRWAQVRHHEAALRMHVASTNAWVERRFDFRRADADQERARTLAFAMVSILPEPIGSGGAARDDEDGGAANRADGAKPANEEAGAPPGPRAHDAGAPSAGGARAPSATDTGSGSRDAASGATPDRAQASAAAVSSTMGLEVLVVDAVGDVEGAQEIGGAAAFDWFFWRNVSVRVGGSVRDTSLDEASGDLLKVIASAGLAIHPWKAIPAHPFGASFRVDYLFLYERLSRVEPPGQNGPTLDDPLSGCDAVLDGSWLFSPSVEVIVGAGVEAFAPTKLHRGATTIALPVARALFEGGLRLRF